MTKPDLYLVITIDTEADHDSRWFKSRPLTFKAVTEAIPDAIAPLFRRYGAVGTYMLSVEVLEDDGAVKMIKSLEGPHELGSHLHPDYIAPDKKYSEYGGTYATEFSNNSPPEIEREKLRSITDLFRERIGYPPRVYRGGKFGFGRKTAEALMDLGYTVDTSVTPRVSWRAIGGPDFRACADQPYFIKSADAGKRLLEVPVSIAYLNGIDRIFNRPAWLRPSFGELKRMKALIDNFLERYKKERSIVLNMMFHNVEFYPNASPYTKNRDDCARLLLRLEETIKYCKAIGVKFVKLSEINDIFKD